MKNSKTLFVSLLALVVLVGVVFAQTKTGKDIFIDSKCNTCHSIKSQEIESKQAGKYPDLSEIGKAGIDEATLQKYLLKEESIKDKKHAVKFKGSEEELTTLVKWLSGLKGEDK